MAQGTGAERFLTKSVKATSAGVSLALVAFVLLLGGCGAGSSADSGSSTASTAAAEGGAAEGGLAAKGGSDSSSAEGASGAAGSQVPGGQGAAAGRPSSAGKHGPAVSRPSGAPAPKITPQQRRQATVADLTLESPSSQPSAGGPRALPARYTCDGKGTSPALRWQGVPSGTAELVLFVSNARPVEGELFFDWAVAGLSPGLEGLEAGRLPKGAIVGRNGFGKTAYEVCPEGGGEAYVFTLFALPKKLSPRPGFEPFVLRREVGSTSGDVGLLALSHLRD
jgi:hypothetical protein